jgi:hypothetical protein
MYYSPSKAINPGIYERSSSSRRAQQAGSLPESLYERWTYLTVRKDVSRVFSLIVLDESATCCPRKDSHRGLNPGLIRVMVFCNTCCITQGSMLAIDFTRNYIAPTVFRTICLCRKPHFWNASAKLGYSLLISFKLITYPRGKQDL